MAKRFTDTSKWNKPFIRSLKASYKLLWFYICDECDHAGIWQVDEEVAKIRVGKDIELDFEKAKDEFKNHIQILDNGQKWFIPDFIDFQYGELNPNNRVHQSIISIHKKHKIKPFASTLNGAKDKDKDKEQDKDKDIDDENKFDEHLEEVFKKFIDMRKKIRKPATEHAIELLRIKLKELSMGDDNLAIEILNQSIINSYQGLFPLKQQSKQPYQQPENKEYI